jgi:hypothetical protein
MRAGASAFIESCQSGIPVDPNPFPMAVIPSLPASPEPCAKAGRGISAEPEAMARGNAEIPRLRSG